MPDQTPVLNEPRSQQADPLPELTEELASANYLEARRIQARYKAAHESAQRALAQAGAQLDKANQDLSAADQALAKFHNAA